ncbi:putative membrane protein YedE/YeeE [Bradyrhizobium sp. USDA 4011]
MRLLASFVCGLIFGAGLLISGMTDPQKVLGFLDLFGAWDATLAFVMAGAVAVAATGFAIARRRTAPAFSARFHWPDRSDIDAPLVGGAILFGIGWGLAGICPGPALVNLAGLSLPIVVFVVAMLAGMIGQNLFGKNLWRRRTMAPRGVETTSLPSRADG